jgi:hypothetical protein
LRAGGAAAKVGGVPERIIERSEVVSLVFDLSDIAVAVRNIERLPREDDGEEEAHEG